MANKNKVEAPQIITEAINKLKSIMNLSNGEMGVLLMGVGITLRDEGQDEFERAMNVIHKNYRVGFHTINFLDEEIYQGHLLLVMSALSTDPQDEPIPEVVKTKIVEEMQAWINSPINQADMILGVSSARELDAD